MSNSYPLIRVGARLQHRWLLRLEGVNWLGTCIASGRSTSVGGEIRHWDEGKSLIFNDSFPRRAWNDTDAVRALLFLDVVRPLPFPVSTLNKSLIRLIAGSMLSTAELPIRWVFHILHFTRPNLYYWPLPKRRLFPLSSSADDNRSSGSVFEPKAEGFLV
jgi:hypothetical protein